MHISSYTKLNIKTGIISENLPWKSAEWGWIELTLSWHKSLKDDGPHKISAEYKSQDTFHLTKDPVFGYFQNFKNSPKWNFGFYIWSILFKDTSVRLILYECQRFWAVHFGRFKNKIGPWLRLKPYDIDHVIWIIWYRP